MRYMMQRIDMAEPIEIRADQAYRFLRIYYNDEAMRDAIKNKKSFRLKTPYRNIWTVTENGMVMEPGFYGIG